MPSSLEAFLEDFLEDVLEEAELFNKAPAKENSVSAISLSPSSSCPRRLPSKSVRPSALVFDFFFSLPKALNKSGAALESIVAVRSESTPDFLEITVLS